MNFYVISIFRNPYARGTSTTINQIYEELLQTGAVNEEFQATVLLFKQDYAHTFQDPNCTGSNGTGKGKGPKTTIPKRTAAYTICVSTYIFYMLILMTKITNLNYRSKLGITYHQQVVYLSLKI